MPNYTNGKIYKLVSNETDNIYIGSTCQSLCKRHSDHKTNYKMWLKNIYNYTTSFEIMKYNDNEIIFIENYSCSSKHDLEIRERYWMEQLNCINKIIPTRTQKEYKENNKDKIKEQKKQYNLNNKIYIDEKNKQYYEQNKDKIKEQKKQYCENNKVEIIQKSKLYYEKNKEQIKNNKILYRENNKEKIKEQLKNIMKIIKNNY